MYFEYATVISLVIKNHKLKFVQLDIDNTTFSRVRRRENDLMMCFVKIYALLYRFSKKFKYTCLTHPKITYAGIVECQLSIKLLLVSFCRCVCLENSPQTTRGLLIMDVLSFYCFNMYHVHNK